MKLGSSWSGSSSWDGSNGNTITNSSTNYSGPDGNGSEAHGLTRMRMVMFFQAALILRPLLKSVSNGDRLTTARTAFATDFPWLLARGKRR